MNVWESSQVHIHGRSLYICIYCRYTNLNQGGDILEKSFLNVEKKHTQLHIHGRNRKEGNDQESIRFPNTFHSRHQKERRMHLRQWYHNQNTTSRKPKRQFLSHKLATWLSKIKIPPGHTYKDNSKLQKKLVFERSIKLLLGGLNWFYVATSLALSSALWSLYACTFCRQTNIN